VRGAPCDAAATRWPDDLRQRVAGPFTSQPMTATCYYMHMMTKRLQVLVDEARFRRLAAEARERRTSVGALVRDAIDRVYPTTSAKRRAAARAILAAPPMPAFSIEELKAELDEIRAGAKR